MDGNACGLTFETLYDEHWGGIFRRIRAMLGSVEVAEDLTQETFLRAYRNWSSFTVRRDEAADRRNWLYRIAHNLTVDYLRHNRRLPVASLDNSNSPGPASADTLGTLDALEGLEALDDRQRRVLVGRILGYSDNEIAHHCRIRPGTMKTTLYLAREKLRA